MKTQGKLAPLRVSQDYQKDKTKRQIMPRSTSFVISPKSFKIKKIQRTHHRNSNNDVHFEKFEESRARFERRKPALLLPLNDIKVVNQEVCQNSIEINQTNSQTNLGLQNQGSDEARDWSSSEEEKYEQDKKMAMFYKEVERKVKQKEWAKRHLDFLKARKENEKYNTEIDSQIQLYREILQYPNKLGKIKKKLNNPKKKKQRRLKRVRNTHSMPDLTNIIQKRSFLPQVNCGEKAQETYGKVSQPSHINSSNNTIHISSKASKGLNSGSKREERLQSSIKYYKDLYSSKIRKKNVQNLGKPSLNLLPFQYSLQSVKPLQTAASKLVKSYHKSTNFRK
ncbi:unnamed protein product [Moneuplotes crassus]|uniref:Uncharacterized protein n=1 Tax=Euplotes crassus TaxID=5936 RepID=A0AAD1XGD3_EUPCR|nr:unnamed protein product [Moneuplotes crassus]